MHSYSTDSNERKWIPLLIIVVSICFAIVLKKYWEGIHVDGTFGDLYYYIGIFVDFSVILFYELIFYVFDKSLWKISFIPFVKVPNLNGTWEGTLLSSYEDKSGSPTKLKPTMEINQTWQNIEIRLESKDSKSKTFTAAFSTKNQNAIELYYQYQNEPYFGAKDTFHMYKGTGCFTLSPDKKSFEGEYYTGRDSHNHGCFKFEKIKD